MDVFVGLLVLFFCIFTLVGLAKPSALRIGWLTTRPRVFAFGACVICILMVVLGSVIPETEEVKQKRLIRETERKEEKRKQDLKDAQQARADAESQAKIEAELAAAARAKEQALKDKEARKALEHKTELERKAKEKSELNTSITQSPKETFDVRKVRWGMSKSEVEKSESWDLVETGPEGPIYKGEILGYECILQYKINQKGKLTDVNYLFLNSQKGKFDTIEIMLREKYGSPISSESNRVGWVIKQRTYIVLHFNAPNSVVLLQFVDKIHKDAQLNKETSKAMEEF